MMEYEGPLAGVEKLYFALGGIFGFVYLTAMDEKIQGVLFH
jgi:hypothetical protein